MFRYLNLVGICLFLVLIAESGNSQVTSSPYTVFGAGEVLHHSGASGRALGGTGIAFQSIYSLNPLNPASYSGIDSMSFLFEFDVLAKYTQYTDGSDIQNRLDGSLYFLAMGFRLTNWWVTSIGVLPYSTVGYDINTTGLIDGLTNAYTINYKGEGGINKFYIGNSLNIGSHLSLGINTSYFFGSIEQSERVEEIVGLNGYILSSKNYVRSVMLDYGMQYYASINKFDLNLGLIYSPQKDLKTTSELTYTDAYESEDITEDKLEYLVPRKQGAGIVLNYNKKLALAFDYECKYWSKMKFSNPVLDTRNSHRYSAGIQIVPDNSPRATGWEKINYRIGFYHKASYMIIKEQPINIDALTFGFGIPLSRKLSRVNIAAEIGQRGTLKNGLIKENYFMLYLSLSLHDKWFQKSLYD